MRATIIAIGICLLATVCTAQEKYNNSKWRFSFAVPEGWEVITDDVVLNNYSKLYETRYEGSKILAVCRKYDSEAESKKNSMLVQANAIGEAKEGLPMEVNYEKMLHSNFQWSASRSYLKSFREDLIKQGDVEREEEYKMQIYYDPNRHIFFETVALPLKKGGAIGISTLKILGSNRMATLSFDLYGENINEISDLIAGVADSFAYDEKYRFGEAPAFDIVRVLWHWLVPGVGTLIICFILYKWVASEYG